MQRITHWMLLILLAGSCVCYVSAQTPDSSAAESERAAARQAAGVAMLKGPSEIDLVGQARLKLPEGYGFIPKKEAARLIRSVGGASGDGFVGLVMPLNGDEYAIRVDYEKEGYIKDDDAKNWDADKLLENLKEGTEAGNKDREAVGMPAIKVTRWIEPPKYDASLHHLVWSAEVQQKNGDNTDPSVNYNTYILGREGYISMDLITRASTVESDKQASAILLAATEFSNGKRYTDFNSSTDKVAEYGLAALVGGIALKKLGLLAVLAGLLVKFKAILIAAVAFLGGIFKRLLGKKDEPKVASTSTSVPQLPAPVEHDSSSENKS